MLKDSWIFFKDTDTLSKQLAKDTLSIADHYIKKNGQFKIVLSGGKSFIDLYKVLRNSKSNWSKWNIYISDERCLPLYDNNRNDIMINKVWLNNGKIPKQNINFIYAELDAKDAVKRYESALKHVGDFDLVLLGMGEDGHVASLFPENMSDDLMRSDDRVFEVVASKPPPQRLTLSYNVLETSKHVCALICGPGKETALRESIGNHGKTPFAHVIQSRVHTEILTDISINDHV